MTPTRQPAAMPTVPEPGPTPEPRSAAEHCAAAEALFARARAIHPQGSPTPATDVHEYQRSLDWAAMHLRMAENITAGAGLLTTHRQLLARPEVRLHHSYLSYETRCWAEFLRSRHGSTQDAAGASA